MIRIETRGAVLAATLTRPPHNTVEEALCVSLEQALEAVRREGSSVLHLRAEGASFCGGADPARIAAWLAPGGAEVAARDAERWDGLYRALEDTPAVVLAELGGAALGAGLGLALAADLRLAGDGAAFGVPEARFGLLPLGGTITRLMAACGTQTARRLLLAGEVVPATEALRLGLVDWVAPAAELAAQAEALAQRIAGQSHQALLEARGLLRGAQSGEAAATARLLALPDTQQRCGRLLEKLAAKGGRS